MQTYGKRYFHMQYSRHRKPKEHAVIYTHFYNTVIKNWKK